LVFNFDGTDEKAVKAMTPGSHRASLSVMVVTVLLSLLACSTFLEIGLRLLPVSEGFRALAVNDANPIYRYAPNRTAVWSKGWNFSITNRVRTNNLGFISEVDYDPKHATPLLAIVGDSYIEAAMVPSDQTAAALLRREIGARGSVYSFGASGSALSQYLAYANYVKDVFRPEGLVVTVVGNDFDESLLRYKQVPGFHYFSQSGTSEVQLIRLDREIPLWRDYVAASSLAMYVVANLEVAGLLDRSLKRVKSWFSADINPNTYVGNTVEHADPARIADSKAAVDVFLKQLPDKAGLPVSTILLVVDAPRPELYEPARRDAATRSYFGLMRAYLMDRAVEKGFEVVDMEREFLDDYSRAGRRFEHPDDHHWNSVGHEVFARAVRKSAVYESVFGGARQEVGAK